MRRRALLPATLLVLSIAVAGCSTFRGSTEQNDHWWAVDKAQHFSLSAASSFGVTWTARSLGSEPLPAASTGFSVTLSGGLLKELWDATAQDGSGWSWRDLAWDLAGASLGTWAGSQLPTGR